MSDLISVVVPAYNVEKYIARCLDSIVSQTHSNIEIIVVNDGSSDGTGAIIDTYVAREPRIKAIHKENGGVTSARLRGVQEASGDWIGFVDGDDYIEPDMYARLLTNALDYNADISHCGYQMVFPDGRVHYFHNTGTLAPQEKITALRELLSGKMIEPGLWNKIFRKSLFCDLLNNQTVPYDININEDLLMNFLLFREAQQTVFEDFCAYHYLIHTSSATRKKLTESALRDPIKVKEHILEKAPVELLDDARCAYLRTCIATYNRIVRERGVEREDVLQDMRKRIKENKSWLTLLSKKNLIFALLILWVPQFYALMYRFYFHTLSKRPYD